MKKFSFPKVLTYMLVMSSAVAIFESCSKDEAVKIPAPTITSFSPSKGPIGATVVISGAHFGDAIADNVVMFGTVSATVGKASTTALTVVVPEGATTAVISVTVKSNTATSADNFTVTSATKTVGADGGKVDGSDGIVSITLPAGAVPANTTVAIEKTDDVAPNGIGQIYSLTPEGTTFAKPVKLSFQYTDADVAKTPIAAMAIAYKTGNANDWQVMPVLSVDQTAKTITTETTHFSRWSLMQVPSITKLSPSAGLPGATITIIGTDFSPVVADNKILLNGVAVTVLTATKTALTFQVPANATSGKIIVTTVFQGLTWTAVSPTDFSIGVAPSITSFSPVTGNAGAIVTITGTSFSTTVAKNSVQIGGTAATVLSATSTSLTFKVPAQAATGKITVTVVDEQGLTESVTSANDFTVFNAPTITSVSPNSGLAGATITISGTDFSPVVAENTVTVNGVAAVVFSASTTAITFQVPAQASSGKIIVTTLSSGLSWTLVAGTDFTVIKPVPTISSFAPASGAAGTTVQIEGTFFSSTVANNIVTINGVSATVLSATATELIIKVPGQATSGNIIATTTTGGQTYTVVSANAFTITTPSITDFNPKSGEEGELITITGQNFNSTLSKNNVYFGPVQATVVSGSATSLVVKVPQSAQNLPITVDVILPDGSSFSVKTSQNFTMDQPTFTGFAPSSGPVGSNVTISGTGMSPVGAIIYIDGVQATIVSGNADQIVVTVPSGAVFGKIVMLMSYAGQTSVTLTSTNDFTVN